MLRALLEDLAVYFFCAGLAAALVGVLFEAFLGFAVVLFVVAAWAVLVARMIGGRS